MENFVEHGINVLWAKLKVREKRESWLQGKEIWKHRYQLYHNTFICTITDSPSTKKYYFFNFVKPQLFLAADHLRKKSKYWHY